MLRQAIEVVWAGFVGAFMAYLIVCNIVGEVIPLDQFLSVGGR